MTNDTNLAQTKDWIYVICTVIQTVLAIIGLGFVSFWWDWRKRKVDRENARKKAGAERIVAILSEKYDEIEKTFCNLRKPVMKLKEKEICTSLGTFTEFDILLYMCHPDNWRKFTPPSTSTYTAYLLPRGITIPNDGRELVMSNVDKIMKFFIELHVQLSSIMNNKTCPNYIMSEFSEKIIEMGELIFPFVTTARQESIKRVSDYFRKIDSVQEHSKCRFHCRCRGKQGENGSDVERIPLTNGQAHRPLTSYPGHSELEDAIAYIESFRYENGEMNCYLTCKNSGVKKFEACIKKGIPKDKENDIRNGIQRNWSHELGTVPDGDLLHLIRLVMFKSNDPNLSGKESLHKLFCYIYSVDGVVHSRAGFDKKAQVIRDCERAFEDIEGCIRELQGDRLKHLLESMTNESLNMVKVHAESMRELVWDMSGRNNGNNVDDRKFKFFA